VSKGGKIYGVADKAWQVVVGCDPHMPCAKRCWARKTVARINECQGDNARELFQIALTPDKRAWSGVVSLDEERLLDPLKWRQPAMIATGFHGDIGRLKDYELDRIFGTISVCRTQRFLLLTKCSAKIEAYLSDEGTPDRIRAQQWAIIEEQVDPNCRRRDDIRATCLDLDEEFPFANVSVGCSVMYQSGAFGADQMRGPMEAIAGRGWSTHVWYEPALGPVNWKGWEFLRGVIAGGESGANSRPSHPQWHRDTRDWCVRHGVPYNFKQWGNWLPFDQRSTNVARHWSNRQVRTLQGGGLAFKGETEGWASANKTLQLMPCTRIDKGTADRLLDGRTWDELPTFNTSREASV
jgi:protein gp37